NAFLTLLRIRFYIAYVFGVPPFVRKIDAPRIQRLSGGKCRIWNQIFRWRLSPSAAQCQSRDECEQTGSAANTIAMLFHGQIGHGRFQKFLAVQSPASINKNNPRRIGWFQRSISSAFEKCCSL